MIKFRFYILIIGLFLCETQMMAQTTEKSSDEKSMNQKPRWVEVASFRQISSLRSDKDTSSYLSKELEDTWKKVETFTCPNQPKAVHQVKQILEQMAQQPFDVNGIQKAWELRNQLVSISCYDPSSRKPGANPQTLIRLSASRMVIQGLIAKASKKVSTAMNPQLAATALFHIVQGIANTKKLPHLQDKLYLFTDELQNGLDPKLYKQIQLQLK